MFREAFEKLELSEIAAILDRLEPLLSGVRFDPVDTSIMAIDLPFYPGYRLMEIADHSVMPPPKRFALVGRDHAAMLDFTNAPIYDLNARVPIALSETSSVEYIRFFLTFVRGVHGRFVLTESVDDIPWKDDPPPQARKAISKMTLPLTFESTDDGGVRHYRATLLFKDGLYTAMIALAPDGVIQIGKGESLVEDLPVLDDVFGL